MQSVEHVDLVQSLTCRVCNWQEFHPIKGSFSIDASERADVHLIERRQTPQSFVTTRRLTNRIESLTAAVSRSSAHGIHVWSRGTAHFSRFSVYTFLVNTPAIPSTNRRRWVIRQPPAQTVCCLNIVWNSYIQFTQNFNFGKRRFPPFFFRRLLTPLPPACESGPAASLWPRGVQPQQL